MKNIDIKSLIIGVLLTSTIFLGVAATGPTDKWDKEQEWAVGFAQPLKKGQVPGKTWIVLEVGAENAVACKGWPKGWEPVHQIQSERAGDNWAVRKRVK
jgi:hypothetical protein